MFASDDGTVVEHSPQYPKVEGSSTPTAGTKVENGRMVKKYQPRYLPVTMVQWLNTPSVSQGRGFEYPYGWH
jgi:hypothetical protein